MDARIQENFKSQVLEERKKLLTEKWLERLTRLQRETEHNRIPEKRP